MRFFSCCFCGDEPLKEEPYATNLENNSAPSEDSEEKSASLSVQEDGGGAPAAGQSSQPLTADEEAPLQLVAGRLAKHLLERQPSKSKPKWQSSSFGGAAGQRWVGNLDGSNTEGTVYHGSGASAGLLLQEVKPLYDPVAGPSTTSRLGAYGSVAPGPIAPSNAHAGTHSSSMNFARSVNRLSALNTSGAFSRRASLLDVDLTKASLQLAMGSSLLRGSLAGASTHGGAPEPWALHNILRLGGPPAPTPHLIRTGAGGGAHSVSHAMPSGLYGHGGFAPSSLPATVSIMATVAAGLNQAQSTAGNPLYDRENSRPSYGQLHVHSPAATHGQHPLHPQHQAYPVPLISRAVIDRVEELHSPLVVLVLRSATAAAGEAENGGGGGPDGKAGGGGGDDEREDEGWQRPSGPVVASMKLDMPPPQSSEARRRISSAAHISRTPSQRYRQVPPHPSQAGDGEGELHRQAYACLASALGEAAGQQVSLTHAWHNNAAGAMLSAIVTAASAAGGESEPQQPHFDLGDESTAAATAVAAAAALADGGEIGAVLWCLRELFEQDPCLPLLARDLLRQAAIRPEHVPPLTHSLVPYVYGALMGGRDPIAATTSAVVMSSVPNGGASAVRRVILGAAALQAAVNQGQLRVHVCVFQASAAGEGARSTASTVCTTPDGAATSSTWLPAIVLEWPAAAKTPPPPTPTPAVHTSAALSTLVLMSPAARGSTNNGRSRSTFNDPERLQQSSSTAIDVPGPSPLGVTAGVPHAAVVAAAAAGVGAADLLGPCSPLALHNAAGVPSLSLGMGRVVSGGALAAAALAAAVAGERPPSALTMALASGTGGAATSGTGVTDGAFGSPTSPSILDPKQQLPAAAAAAAAGGGMELAPLAGADLLYVIQTWQRHHLLLASVPYAITLFDCGGRVLQQNQGSVDFMGEITGDPMEQHQNFASTAASALGSEARNPATCAPGRPAPGPGAGTEPATEPAGEWSATATGNFGGGSGGLMDVSEVDVLSVLFCLCPDLLDEMLEEVICGNMWRGIVQVPRVMRPCIRAAQRWGAAGKAAAATSAGGGGAAGAAASQGSPTPTAAAAAVAAAVGAMGGRSRPRLGGGDDDGTEGSIAAAAADPAGHIGGGGGGGPDDTDGAVLSRGPYNGGAAAAAAAALHPPGSPCNVYSSTSNVVESTASPSIAGAADSPLQHLRSFNSGRPRIDSPLRCLAASVSASPAAAAPEHSLRFGRTGAGSAGDATGEHSIGGDSGSIGSEKAAGGALKRAGPNRRPPARSYSLRGLMRPMVNNLPVHPTGLPSQPRSGGPHRLAAGDVPGGLPAAAAAAAAAPPPLPPPPPPAKAAVAPAAPATPPQAEQLQDPAAPEAPAARPATKSWLLSRAAPALDANVRSSLKVDTTEFRSFSRGHSEGLLPGRPLSEQLLPEGPAAATRPDSDADGESSRWSQQQLPMPSHQLLRRTASVTSPAFGAQAQQRSSVLAFAERLRKGRGGGSGGGGSDAAAAAAGGPSAGAQGHTSGNVTGLFSGARTVPRRLRSGLSQASGPDGPPQPGSAGGSMSSVGSPFTGTFGMLAGTLEGEPGAEDLDVRRPRPGIPAADNAAAAMAAAASGAAEAAVWRDDVAGGDFDAGDSVTANVVDVAQSAASKESQRRSSWDAPGVQRAPGFGGGGAAAGPSFRFGRLPQEPRSPVAASAASAAAAAPPQLLSQFDPRALRMMSDPVAPPTLPDATLVAEARNEDSEPSVALASAPQAGDDYAAAGGGPKSPTATAETTYEHGAVVPPNGTTELQTGDAAERPHHSVPLQRMTTGGGGGGEILPPLPAGGGGGTAAAASRNLSASGGGVPQSGHARGGVRRQLNALKRPLSRTSTRTYLLTAMSTSTLNVLGRVHSMRQLAHERALYGDETAEDGGSDGGDDDDGLGVAEEDRGDGRRRAASLQRASTTTAAALTSRGRRSSTTHHGVFRSRSQSLNVAAAEPRMAVPRIFSFMRSASKRMLQHMQDKQAQNAQQHTPQGAQQDPAGEPGSEGGGEGTAPITISPVRRHTFDQTSADVYGSAGHGSGGAAAAGSCSNSNSVSGRVGSHRLSQSPRRSPRASPRTRMGAGLEPVYSSGGGGGGHGGGGGGGNGHGNTLTVSGSLHGDDAVGGRGSSAVLETALLEESSRGGQERHLAASRTAGGGNASAAMLSSSSDHAGRGSAAAAAAAAEPAEAQMSPPPPLPPALSRLRASAADLDGSGGMRMMSPRDMSPAEMARRVGMAWHEVAATSFTDPVTGARVVALVQNDVSEKVETEMQLTELMEVEHRLLEQIFPRHVLEYIAMQNISGTTSQHMQGAAGGGGGGGERGGGGRRQRRMSQFDLLKSQDSSQLAHHHEQITVLFCDVKGFTAMCSSVEPAVVMTFLNMLYTQFDSLLYVHDVYKVETIGDCYMVAGGLVRRGSDGVATLLEPGEVDPNHARKVVNFAKDLLEVVREMRMPNGQELQVRVGMHSGAAMSGVVGTKMPRFCLFGDTINTASRCESTCPASSIHATTSVRDLVPEEAWVATGGVMAKGKGIMRTFVLRPHNPASKTPEEVDDGTVSDLCSSQRLGGSGGGRIDRGDEAPVAPPPARAVPAAATAAAAAAAAMEVQTAVDAARNLAAAGGAVPEGASALGSAASVTAAPAPRASASPPPGRHSAVRRMGSGLRRSSLRAITTTSAAVAAAAAAAAAAVAAAAAAAATAGGTLNSDPSAPPGSIAAAVLAAAATAAGGGGGGSYHSGPVSPGLRIGSSSTTVNAGLGLPHVPNTTISGYLRLPSMILSSSPAETATTNTVVRNLAAAGELPYITPVVDTARASGGQTAGGARVASVSGAVVLDPEGVSLPSTHDVHVVNMLTEAQLRGGGADGDAGPGSGAGPGSAPGATGAGGGLPPPLDVVSHSVVPAAHVGVSVFAAQNTRTDLGHDFLSSSAVVPASGLLFESGGGATGATGATLHALPPIVYEVPGEHEPQDLGDSLRGSLLASRNDGPGGGGGGGGGGGASGAASRASQSSR